MFFKTRSKEETEDNALKVVNRLADAIKLQMSQPVITMGSFDGIHLGHRQLLAEQKRVAGSNPKVVITFDPHPAKILSSAPPPQIFNQKDQIDIFDSLGVDLLFFIPFDQTVAQMSADQFMQDFLWQPFQPSAIVTGYDFTFGRDRKGNGQTLATYFEKRGVQLVQVPAFLDQGEIVSSSLLRQLLKQGQIERVNHLLGRPYYLSGSVMRGKQLGRTLGFPTVNLACENEIYPQSGVYLATVVREGKTFKAVGNIGFTPTVEMASPLRIEFYILDFSGDLYDQNLTFFLQKKIRDETKFANLNELRLQIQKDVEVARNIIL